jgi:hypothetical protein
MMNIMIKMFISLLFVTASLSATVDGPDYFSIRGITHDDFLKMHSQPNQQSLGVQGISPNESCVKNLGCREGWCKVSYLGVIGWVEEKHLGEGECTQSKSNTQNTQRTSYYNETIKQMIEIHHVTWGACMVIREDIKFCTNAVYNHETSMCILDIDTSHSSYQNLYQKCFNVSSSNWRISYQNGQWRIDCSN